MGLLSLHNCVRANSYEKSPDAISLCILLVVSWGPQHIWCPHEKHTLSGPDSSGHLNDATDSLPSGQLPGAGQLTI